jgi:hypothetical protein
VRYGLSLMNEWATAGGNPFANAKWDEAWNISAVTDDDWQEIRDGLREESERWRRVLEKPRDLGVVDLKGYAASVAHLAYHLGAMRQIAKSARGPREGDFTS